MHAFCLKLYAFAVFSLTCFTRLAFHSVNCIVTCQHGSKALDRLPTLQIQNELHDATTLNSMNSIFISSAHLGRDLGRVLTNICFYVLILLCRHFTEFWAHRTLPWVSQIFLMRMWVQYLYAQDTSRWSLFGLPISKTSSFDFELKC